MFSQPDSKGDRKLFVLSAVVLAASVDARQKYQLSVARDDAIVWQGGRKKKKQNMHGPI